MERHASESYDVMGEGLLAVSAGGRARATAPGAPFRFSRMGPRGDGCQLEDTTIPKLARNMVRGGGSTDEVSGVPAGYTYLGQFVAHDLSFDKTTVTLGENISPARLREGTSPALDLDSLYGAGPHDPLSARFYERDRVRLKTGTTVAVPRHRAEDGFDLPRGGGDRRAERRKAVIADERNDDNVAVAQTHLWFIRFHNSVVKRLRAESVPHGLLFERARALVTKHYQWVVRHDYLPLICDDTVLDDVFGGGRDAFEVDAARGDMPTMPIEFSIGAFRLGHSMVRNHYRWNHLRDTLTLEELFVFAGKGGNLGGKERLPSDVISDFRRMYDFRDTGLADFVVDDDMLNRAMRIDTRIVTALGKLPAGAFGEPGERSPPLDANLAFRNLTRAKMVQLASGPQMAEFLTRRGVKLTPLSPDQILKGRDGTTLHGFDAKAKQDLVEHAPLWFYILREAELNGGKLSGVGARIVAETFHRAIEASAASIVRKPDWRPTLRGDGTHFGMPDLLLVACREDPRLMAPLESRRRR